VNFQNCTVGSGARPFVALDETGMTRGQAVALVTCSCATPDNGRSK